MTPPKRDDPNYKRDWNLKDRYGISLDQYNQLLEAQAGRCAICRNQPKTRALHVDHDHKSGKIRGLLCMNCNRRLLSAAYDSPFRLFNAGLYLLNPPADKVLGVSGEGDAGG